MRPVLITNDPRIISEGIEIIKKNYSALWVSDRILSKKEAKGIWSKMPGFLTTYDKTYDLDDDISCSELISTVKTHHPNTKIEIKKRNT